jgi:MerR family redox-sensitive transcriptional activator SoxR
MSWLSISEVARRASLRPSAIRYYEKAGILPKPERISGKRRYDRTVLYRLAVIQQAREAGFTLSEIRALFFLFPDGTRAETRWRRLADRKLAELNALATQIRSMRMLLKRMKANCHCKTLEVCGKAIFEKGISRVEKPPSSVKPGLLRS